MHFWLEEITSQVLNDYFDTDDPDKILEVAIR